MNLANYRTIVFDCDGVILDSNRIKTEAFRDVAAPIDTELADELVRYHVENGGVSRYRKFDFFLQRCREKGIEAPGNDELCRRFGDRVRGGLLECPVAEHLDALRAATPSSAWMVASGADQAELREVFEARGLASLFDAGIYGSPTGKREIVRRAFEQHGRARPGLMLGDSREDYMAAIGADLDFVFLAAWSEFGKLAQFARENDIPVLENLAQLFRGQQSQACSGSNIDRFRGHS